MSVGEDLLQRRTAAGLTQGKLARLADIDQARYSEIERGRTLDPRASTLAAIYNALGVSMPWQHLSVAVAVAS